MQNWKTAKIGKSFGLVFNNSTFGHEDTRKVRIIKKNKKQMANNKNAAGFDLSIPNHKSKLFSEMYTAPSHDPIQHYTNGQVGVRNDKKA